MKEAQDENTRQLIPQNFGSVLLPKSQPMQQEVFSLCIGGTHEIMTTTSVLCDGLARGSRLEQLFSEEGRSKLTKVGDKFFIDRDGKTF